MYEPWDSQNLSGVCSVQVDRRLASPGQGLCRFLSAWHVKHCLRSHGVHRQITRLDMHRQCDGMARTREFMHGWERIRTSDTIGPVVMSVAH